MKRHGLCMLMVVAFGWYTPAHGQVIPAAAKQSELDQPIAWLQEAKRNYTEVKDYTCHLVTQENVKGKLQEQSVILLKLKAEPFSVHLRWIDPKESQNQEVFFVKDKNNNKMRVKNTKLFPNIVGYFSIDPRDPRVLQHSRHTILEAGIGNMIDQCLTQWEKDRLIGKTKVEVTPCTYTERECYQIELTRSAKNPAFYCHRTLIYLDKKSKLPIRLQNFDWPVDGGTPGGELLETFSYVNLRFNVGLKDADFVK